MRGILILFLAVQLSVACTSKDKIPSGILPKEKMEVVLWDMIAAGEFLSGYVLIGDSIDKRTESSKVFAQVLQVHDITREQFENSYRYYQQHPALMRVILDTLSKKQQTPTYPMQETTDSVPRKVLQVDVK